MRILQERCLRDDLPAEAAARVIAHVKAKRVYFNELIRQGQVQLSGVLVDPATIPSTVDDDGLGRAAPFMSTINGADGAPDSDTEVVRKVRQCLLALQSSSHHLHDLLKSLPQGTSEQCMNSKQLPGVFSSCDIGEHLAQGVYSSVCEWGFVLWPVLLAADPTAERCEGIVRFRRQEALGTALRRPNPHADGKECSSAAAASVPSAELRSVVKSAKHAKPSDGHAILELPYKDSTFEYTIVIQESKKMGLSDFEGDFLKSCKEATSSLAVDCSNFRIQEAWMPAAAGDAGGQREGMRASPYPPKYIFQVSGVELHVFAVEALASDLFVVYQVAAGSLEDKPLDHAKLSRLPSADVQLDCDNLLFVSYAIIRQLQAWLHSAKPSVVKGEGNVSLLKHTSTKVAGRKEGPNGPNNAGSVRAEASASLKLFGSSLENLKTRYALGDAVWNHPHSVVLRAVRRADSKPVVLKRCLFETAVATLRADHLLRSATSAGGGIAQAGTASDVACDCVTVPVLEFFFDPVPSDPRAPRMATLVFPQLSEVCVPSEVSLRQRRDDLVAEEALAWFWDFSIQLADRVSTLHSLQLSHGDLKPLNVMVDDSSGRVCLIDMGQSQYPLDTGTLHYQHGTRHWRPPELVSFEFAWSEAGDRWSLGAVILHALFSSMNAIAFDAVVTGPYDDDDVDEACDQLQELYDDAEWVRALRAVLRGCFGASYLGHLRYTATRMRDELQQAFELYLGKLSWVAFRHCTHHLICISVRVYSCTQSSAVGCTCIAALLSFHRYLDCLCSLEYGIHIIHRR